MSVKAKVLTSITREATIVQEVDLHDEHDNIVQQLSRFVINTQDAQLRKALVKLGWTPPGECKDEHCQVVPKIKAKPCVHGLLNCESCAWVNGFPSEYWRKLR